MDERVDNRITRTSGMNTWRAGCSGSCTSGSEGGPQKPTRRKPDRALRPDPYAYVPTWSGVAYVCFIIDAHSRMIVGWRVAAHMRTEMVLDALSMAAWSRGTRLEGLITHSDAGSQFTSVRFGAPRVGVGMG
jgi:putative transposase